MIGTETLDQFHRAVYDDSRVRDQNFFAAIDGLDQLCIEELHVDCTDTVASRLKDSCMRLPNLGCIRVEDRSPILEHSLHHPGLGDYQFPKRARLDITWSGPYNITHPRIQSTHSYHVDSRKFAYETEFELVRELIDAGKPTWIDIVMQGVLTRSGVIRYPPVFNVSKAEATRLPCRYLRVFTCEGLYITEESSKLMVNLYNVLER
jgi:hypothetical protein